MSALEEKPESVVSSAEDNPALSLVEIEPGVAVLFADQLPPDFDLISFESTSGMSAADLTNRIALTVGAASLAAEVAAGAVAAQGLVRLTPDTLKLLEIAQPMISAGENLGALVGDTGKIVSLMRWNPALDAQAALLATSMGPIVTLVTIQAQLISISRGIDENIGLTQGVLQAIREDQWATLKGLHETTRRAVEEAQAIRGVNDHIFNTIITKEPELRKQRQLFTSFVRDHVKALDGDVKSRRAYIQKNFGEIIADAHGMLMAEGSWYRWAVLRAAHIIRDEEKFEENEKLLAKLVADTKRDHGQAMDTAYELITELERQCRLMAELPGGFKIPFLSRGENPKSAVVMAEALSEKLAELRHRIHEVPAPLAPEVVAFKKEVPEEVLRILRWAMPDEGPLLAFADMNVHRLISENSYLGVTPEHLFIASQSAVRKQGILERSIRLEDIRYVRFREREKHGPTLDLITKDEDFKLSFDEWAHKDTGLEQARRIANLLTAAMGIPENERRTDPLLTGHATEVGELTQG